MLIGGLGHHLPLAFAPVGELGQEYKLIWEKDAKSYADLRHRCSEIPGYSGIVESRDGLGVRVRCAQHTNALGFPWAAPRRAL